MMRSTYPGRAAVAALLTAASPAMARTASNAEKVPTLLALADMDQKRTIVVTGTRTKTPALGALGDKPVLDTPFSINTYYFSLIKDIQATSLTDQPERDHIQTLL